MATSNSPRRIFVAMSGGVDSSVAAALLTRDGHDVTGVTMRLLPGDDPIDGCCSLDGVRSAKRVCDALGIPHYTLEFSEVFARDVIEPYCDEYARGRTPNPCIVCNDRVKFAELMRRVMLQGADALATGHYARIERDADDVPWLARGVDTSKDQSYFLYRMTPVQLEHTVFPLGDLTKVEVREIARSLDLPAAERPESQETCFVPGDDVRAFVRERRPEAFRSGPIVDAGGSVLGTHNGVPGFTIGQRRGLGISGEERVFVSGIDAETATVTVAPRGAMTVSAVLAHDPVWRAGGDVAVSCRLRYRGLESPGTASMVGDALHVRFDPPVESPAAGQALVCYAGDRVLGGGVIGEFS
jgi:tRNA-specific 2-thiouridylase